jgi:shikimate 5-dehydrogenase
MLVAQAAEQFRLWTGRAAPTDVMLKAARQRLEARGQLETSN